MSTFDERAKRRQGWPVSRTDLADEAPPRGPEDATAAWHAVLELTREAFALSSTPLEDVPRSQWPSRLYRPGEPRPDSNGL